MQIGLEESVVLRGLFGGSVVRVFLGIMVSILFVQISPAFSQYDCPEALVGITYKSRVGNAWVARESSASLDWSQPMFLGGSLASEPGIVKTVIAINLANAIAQAIHAYHSGEEPHPSLVQAADDGDSDVDASTRVARAGNIPLIEPVAEDKTASKPATTREKRIADALRSVVEQLELSLSNPRGDAPPFAPGSPGKLRKMRSGAQVSDPKLARALEYANKLANLIEQGRPSYGYDPGYTVRRGRGLEMTRFAAAAPSGFTVKGADLNVSVGGAQDANHLRALIDQGVVPQSNQFDAGGFLREFNLPIQRIEGSDALTPSVAGFYVPQNQRLYVQVEFNPNVNQETFDRRPLNLAVALDISGSMTTTDGTSKSRLEWAKEALRETLQQLGPQDRFSLVVFDDQSEIIIEALPATNANIEVILKKLEGIKTKGATDVDLGLKTATNGIEAAWITIPRPERVNYENRVILISDVNHNHGESTDGVENTARKMADREVYLTTIGVGTGFNADLARRLTEIRGGNYIFAKTGEQIWKVFDRLPFLVTPFALDVRLDLSVKGADLLNAYGVPREAASGATGLVYIPTLFLVGTEDGGGAIVLEFDLKKPRLPKGQAVAAGGPGGSSSSPGGP